MQKKAFITGISGFAGSFLAEHLLSTDTYKVAGTYLTKSSLDILGQTTSTLSLYNVDLLDKQSITKSIDEYRPDVIFHLAAISNVPQSFKDPGGTITNNVQAQLHLFSAVQDAKLDDTKIVVVSSADVYGNVPSDELPIDEQTPFAPPNPYAVSKLTQDMLGLQYFLAFRLPVIRVRPFNHIGPRQSEGFVISDFAAKIARIENGKEDPTIYVGNLEPKRDFTDVRDMVRAYALLAEKGHPGDVYNIGTGVSHTIRDVLNTLLRLAKVPIAVAADKKLFRPSETLDRVCNAAKMQTVTHWKPEISLRQSLEDTLDYWRKIV